MTHRIAPTRTVALALLAAVAACVACLAGTGLADAKVQKSKGSIVNVMTRNLYLGADLGPALASKSNAEFFEANGGIVRQVEATNFPVRAKGLAKEILENEPDLVGLQEVALWREGEPSAIPAKTGVPVATKVK